MKRNNLIPEITEAMSSLKRGMRASMQHAVQDMPISLAQVEVLSAMKQHEPLSSKDLALQLQLTPGAISQLIDGLSRDLLIERTVDQEDRRLQFLSLSPKGHEQLHFLEMRRSKLMGQIMAELSVDELEALLLIQKKMICATSKLVPLQHEPERH